MSAGGLTGMMKGCAGSRKAGGQGQMLQGVFLGLGRVEKVRIT